MGFIGLKNGGIIEANGATFLTFSDYAKNAIRMSAMMDLPVTYLLTHDSIAVGEDGPTHQPIEQINNLRAIPRLKLWRPSSALECAVAWHKCIDNKSGPNAIVLSRQKSNLFFKEAAT